MTDHHEPKPKQKYYKLSDFDDHVKDYFKKKCSTNLFEPIGIHHIGQGANAVLLVRKNPTGHKDWCRYIEGMQYGPSVDKLNLEKDFTLTRNDFVFITDDLFGQIIYKNQTY